MAERPLEHAGKMNRNCGAGSALTPVVECWIGVAREGEFRVVRLAGRLSAAQVPELLWACQDDDSVKIDLADLISVDVAGIDALQRIREKGAILTGASGYIQLKLDSPGGESTGSMSKPAAIARAPRSRRNPAPGTPPR
jgi:hypothetical protein